MAEKEALHSGHRQRMRQRFLSTGFDTFAEHEILEVLLYYAIPRIDTNEIAHRLLQHFGSLPAIFDADPQELIKVKGVSENTAVLLKMIPSLARVYLSGGQEKHPRLDTPDKLGAYLADQFIGRTNEVVLLLCMDVSLRLIRCETISEGSVSSSHVDIKKIAERVIRLNAPCAVLAHNHPRGLAVPSNDDVLLTRKVKRLLSSLDVKLLDHIVVADGLWCSIAEKYPNL